MHYKEVKAILSPQNGLNVYRGCSYSCVFCDARSTCHRMDHEFDDIEVKAHAVDMLEYALKKKRTKSMIQIGASSEPYIPLEEELQLVRRCLNQIERFDFGLVLYTHSTLALRDIDILDKINRKTKCIVIVRLSTSDDALAKQMEADTSLPSERLMLMKKLTARGITVIVRLAPILPFINDSLENIQELLSYCEQANVYGILTDKMCPVLREGNRERFYQQLYKKFPDIYDRYEEVYGDEKTLKTENYDAIMTYIRETCEAHGIQYDKEELLRFTREYKNKTIGTQLSLFDMI
ncbi:SPL family radical SAM protein [Eubacterium sp. MSJ-33]|uniref:SPL family radical SAM protein n=1 Tax=Eubacterium sp. MSJ-33 TaxID=2841528 RepID=UPI001C79044A|nr:radical SAM protein [Eubacterium sp. MSJ-33]QWT54086.1 radical SAM protein [Eubacterium sp. MSJ-33]